MTTPPHDFMEVARAIARRDAKAHSWLRSSPALPRVTLAAGATRATPTDFFLTEIAHYVYAGDTLLHVAAAASSGIFADLDVCVLDVAAATPARDKRRPRRNFPN